jgi:hypothetical protein
MRVTAQLGKGLKDVVGRPIFMGQDTTNEFGKVTEYDSETGEATMEMNEEKLKSIEWAPIAGISSRGLNDAFGKAVDKKSDEQK